MMVELSPEIIDVMKKVKDAVLKTDFKINEFNVRNTFDNGEMITIDIRRHEKKEGEKKCKNPNDSNCECEFCKEVIKNDAKEVETE